MAIDLSDNLLTGSIDFVASYPNLKTLTLNNNNFSGIVPDEIWTNNGMQGKSIRCFYANNCQGKYVSNNHYSPSF